MNKLSQLLQAILDNPDDLSTLPQLVARADELEKAEEQYLDRIAKLQEVNKSYLAQIPIPGNEPEVVEEDSEPTIEDAKEYLLEALKGDK